MAIPSYWATDFIKSTTAAFTDVADWLVAIRTALTSTLPVASRWTETPANTFNSVPDPISGNYMKMVISRTSALRLQIVHSQVVGGVLATTTQGEMDISGSVQASIFAGPTHFWTENPGSDFAGCVLIDPTPESPNAISSVSWFKIARNVGQANFDLHADYWMAIDGNGDGGSILRARGQGPWYPVNANTCQMITAAGSYVFFPVVGVTYPTAASNANLRFCGTFPQFVWVDQSFTAGSSVSVPIDVGVVGVFQVVTSKVITSNGTQGPVLAVRSA